MLFSCHHYLFPEHFHHAKQKLYPLSNNSPFSPSPGPWHPILLGWPKSAFGFLSKNKRHIFHFHQELYSPFCSTTFCHFSDNFIITSSQNFLSFWAKNSRCLLQSSRELKCFPLREFCKDLNKWKSKGAVSGEYGGWIGTSQASCNSFCLVIKKNIQSCVFWRKIMSFLLTNPGRFSSSAAFSWCNWELYLLELIVWFSGRSS